MVFLEFEQPLESLYDQLEQIRQIEAQGDVDVSAAIRDLENKIIQTKKEIYGSLTGWQRVQLSRHPERPYTLFYIQQMFTNFVELHGDSLVHDDKAMRYIIDVMGADKICLGSDYPFPLGEHHPGKLIAEMNFGTDLKEKLLSRNAKDWLNV